MDEKPEIQAIRGRYKKWDDPHFPYNGRSKSQRERDVRVLLRHIAELEVAALKGAHK